MNLVTGTRLGPYEIIALIGEGGMGEVYKARDTRLDRVVAIKVSKDAFSERFEREARNIAALNHPNICTLHDIGSNYLVMEFVEGEMISGPVPIDTALSYARQIAEAIEAAHEKGIVHRDLKPANIKVTPEGSIKVLDFGLAKALDADVPSPPAQDSPTLSMAMTRAGMILGTAAYMSPEQAKGKPADRRADIWAFGVVLYEILVGKQAFNGETAAETLASVLKEPISLGNLPKETPPALRSLLARCLERDVRRRLQAIGEARIILENPDVGQAILTPALPDSDRRQVRLSHWVWKVFTAVLFLALLAGAIWHFRPSPAPGIVRFAIQMEDGMVPTGGNRVAMAISRDGTQWIRVNNNRLYLRSMQDLEARAIPGTDIGGLVINPVFSPDGKSVAFWAQSDTTLKRVAIGGGVPVTICKALGPYGMTWGEDGLVFAQFGKGIMRVSPDGGQPETIVASKDPEIMAGPQMLPGGRQILFTLAPGPATWERAQIVVQDLKSGLRTTVVDAGNDARYLSTGHLVYALGSTLFAVPFDVNKLKTTGGPVGMVEGVGRDIGSGVAHYGISDTGTLIYGAGGTAALGRGSTYLVRTDRKGNIEPLKQLPPGAYDLPRVSWDGKRIAYQLDDGKQSAIWIYPLSGENAPSPLTLSGTGANRYPVWASDNEHVAFQSDREGDLGIYWQRADGTTPAERLTKPEMGAAHIPDSWSPNGYFSFTETKGSTSAVWIYSLKEKKAALFAEMPAESLGRSMFSREGHWVAFQSVGAQGTQAWVQPFPATGARFHVPQDGNPHHPVFTPNGKELFYVAGAAKLSSVAVIYNKQAGVTFSNPVAAPKSGFNTMPPANARNYDMLPDGEHFIGISSGDFSQPAARAELRVVLNWFEELKQRVPLR